MNNCTQLPLRHAIELDAVSKTYNERGRGNVTALANVTLNVGRGEFVVIVGHNGSGKSTLLSIIGGSARPDSGRVQVRRHYDDGQRPQVARVRQTPSDGVFDGLTVLQNFVLFTLRGPPSPVRAKARQEVVERAFQRLTAYGLQHDLHRPVEELSQGQRQLLALELAMSGTPDVLLLDEHTASLDRTNAQLCMEATVALARTSGVTVLMITHKIDEALTFGDSLVVMRDGRISHRFSGADKRALTAQDLVKHCGYI